MEPERQQREENKLRYSKTVSYDLEIKMEEHSLLMKMEVVDDHKISQYRLQLQQEDIPRALQQYTPKVEDVFSLMGGEDKFMVRPIEGKIDLILPSKSKHQLKHTLAL